MRHGWLGGLLLLAVSASAWARQAQVDLTGLDEGMVGPRTQVLVLGSMHLSQLPKGVVVTDAQLAPVLDRLAAFKPDIITIEAIPGMACDAMRRYAESFGTEDIDTYCPSVAEAQAATGKDVPAAVAEVQRQLKHWPQAPIAAQRRHLAAMFLASGDPASALVQWLQLPQKEQRAGDGLDDVLVAFLQRRLQRPNEDVQIAVRLAVRLGLQRVYPVDDQFAGSVQADDWAAYGRAVQGAWDRQAHRAAPRRAELDALIRSGDMLGAYRGYNAPDFRRLSAEVDFQAAQRDPSPEHYGQRYVTGWDVRNLRMVTAVGMSFIDHPGARVLAVVGAQHKPWFERLLGQMQGVEVVDTASVLGESGAQR